MPTKREIQDWLIAQIAELLEIAPDSIDIREPFANYGLSSLHVVTLSGDLELFLGRRLPPTLAYDYPNILSLARYLAEEMEKGEETPGRKSPGPSEPIAIIGIGCRFPGADDPESFWRLLCEGKDMISEVPADRWPKEAFYHPDPSVPGKSISRWGGFLDRIDQFDPFFFGISPIEAESMDPQQRLLLELSFEALDDAGLVREHLDGSKTGVFVGISVNEYSQLQFADPSRITGHSGTGSALSIAANRLSYFYNFHGPSIAIDTACSSSLSAVHLACQSLRSGECEMALAGGVNMILSPAHSIAFTKAGVLAPDGRCKTFDAQADGYVRGEGGGLVVLKPLSSALADGDPVYALILGSAMHQDGRTNGLIAPSREAQETLLRRTYRETGVEPGSVQYVEAHGTGTLLGDSMEAAAIGAAIGTARSNGPCAIGSVKTNIGHLESAAGIAGLIKVALSLKYRTLPPSLHYHTPNPHIPFEALNLRVQHELTPWPDTQGPAQAGVSSFGFGGTTVHLIMREAAGLMQEEKSEDHIPRCHMLPLSANSVEALQSLAGRVENMLSSDFSIAAKDLCYAASERRSQYHYRLAAVGHSRKELSACLQAFLRRESYPNLFLGLPAADRPPGLAFVFPGQGGQWFGMGRELLTQEPVFHQAIEQINHHIQAHFGWSLMDVLYAAPSESRLDEIDVVQPVLFAIQVALAALWRSWGVVPDAVVGHSMGEVAAAHVAGALSLEDAIQVICRRSQLMKSLRGRGRMLATELSPAQAEALLAGNEDKVAIAVVNSPSSTVISGDADVLRMLIDELDKQNLFCKPVNVDVASHSPQVDRLRPELLEALAGLEPQTPKLPVYSTVTGARTEDLFFRAEYWMDNLRKPVLFSDAIGRMLDDGFTAFIEIGPHPVLLGAVQQSAQARQLEARLFPSMRREEPEREVMLRTLGELYTGGFSIFWDNLYLSPGKFVPLPRIPWQHQRYWLETPASPRDLWNLKQPYHPLLGERIDLANVPSSFVWQAAFGNQNLQFLEEHLIDEEMVFPASAYIEMALQAAEETGLSQSHELSDFVFHEKMTFRSGQPRLVQTLFSPEAEGVFSFSIYSRTGPGADWKLYASASFLPAASVGIPAGISMEPIRREFPAQFSGEEFYRTLLQRGVYYGPDFRAVERVWAKENESLGQLSMPAVIQYDAALYRMHPAFLDACLQVLAATQGTSAAQDLYVPVGCKRIRFYARPGQALWSRVALAPDAGDHIQANISLFDEQGRIVASLDGFTMQRIGRRPRHTVSVEDTWLYQLRWQAQEMPAVSSPLGEGRNWLIFADEEGLGESLARQLEARGDYCRLLRFPGGGSDEAALQAAIEQGLRDIPTGLYGVVHLWSLTIPAAFEGIPENREQVERLGCNSVLYLVQALSRRLGGLPRLWLVTRGAQAVRPGEPAAIEQAPLWGLGKVISFEIPELQCVRVDLDLQESLNVTQRSLLNQISIDDREDQIAFRAGARYVLRLLPFSPAASCSAEDSPLRADAAYLITGGMGGLGLETAKWMVQRGARHLVLAGRSQPSDQVMRVVEQLQREGAEVLMVQADVSEWSHVERLVANFGQNMPPLRGIIHAAGVLDDGSLLNLDAERMRTVMAPRVDGTWHLHQATLHQPLDFFVLFSSAVSVLGSPGQANYAAASSYLDAVAYYRRSLGLPAVSINWGPWAEVGLAAENPSQRMVKVIKIDQGLQILEQLLMESTPQVMVLPFDLKNLIELYPAAAGMPFLEEVGGNETHVARLYARPNLRQEYLAPRNEIELKLAELWRQTLHIDRVGVRDSFFELGGDSVLGAQILSLTQKTFGIRISPQEAFKAFTIERLAEMLEAEILRQIEEMSEEEARQRLSKHN